MIIINADDWGGSRAETDAALACYRKGRITSASAMVFMQDSERAADLAKQSGADVGLHLNLSQIYNGQVPSRVVADAQARIVRFLTTSKYALLTYHPGLRQEFRDVYQAQVNEFERLYEKLPSHVDGHHHKHLCSNMIIDGIIPRGQKVRRNFSFWPGEKGLLNRTYRDLSDKWLSRRYRLTDYFFSLGQCLRANGLGRVTELAKVANVELMTHPVNAEEYGCLMSDGYLEAVRDLHAASYAML